MRSFTATQRKRAATIAAAIILGLSTPAIVMGETKQEKSERKEGGPLIYIEESGGFEMYLAAAMTKKKVPARFAVAWKDSHTVGVGPMNAEKLDEISPDYALRSTTEGKEPSTGSQVVRCLFVSCLGLEGTSTAGVVLIDMATGETVWSYEVQKVGAYNYQSRAEAVAKHLGHWLTEAGK